MEAGSGTPPERRGVERSSGGGEQGGRESGGRPGKTEGGGAVREKNLHPRAGGDFQLLQKQLPLLWNPLRQQPGVPLPADGGRDPVLRRGGLSAWISHLCAPGRGGRVLYRRTALRDSGGIEKTIFGLRGYPFSGGAHQRELRAFVWPRVRTVICSATRPRTEIITAGCTRRKCPGTTGCVACGI